jgi:hypothetical protein
MVIKCGTYRFLEENTILNSMNSLAINGLKKLIKPFKQSD